MTTQQNTTLIRSFIATTLDRTVTNPFDSEPVSFYNLDKRTTQIDGTDFWIREAEAQVTYSENGATITAVVVEFGCSLPMFDLDDLLDEDELEEMDDNERQSLYNDYLRIAVSQAERLSELTGIALNPMRVVEESWGNVLVMEPVETLTHIIRG